MKALFKHSSGRLRTSRIAFFVFLVLLVCLSFMYKAGKSADKVLVKIEHVFEADKMEKNLEKSVPPKIEQPVEQAAAKPVEKSVEKLPEKPAKKPVEKKIEKLVQKSEPKVRTEAAKESQPEKKPLPKDSKEDLNKKELKLSSKEYFETYRQWQEQGETMDKEKPLVNLRILNLENVYELFQMKAVVIKGGVPHTDLEDNSRIAKAALSEFSSTCFVVSNPWEKWGRALKDAGFSREDNIEVRYYTYEFVRNSIYARALQAFEWSVAQKNMSKDTDPAHADVLGAVYAMNKAGGGSFGVFVPRQVDFKADISVEVDPFACFKGQKDIEALNRAGLL